MGIRLAAGLAACVLAAVGALATPPPGPGPAVALSGWPRLGIYAVAGVLLGLTSSAALQPHVKSTTAWLQPLVKLNAGGRRGKERAASLRAEQRLAAGGRRLPRPGLRGLRAEQRLAAGGRRLPRPGLRIWGAASRDPDLVLGRRAGRRGYALAGLGVSASVLVAVVNVRRLTSDIADPFGPALWILSLLILLSYLTFPQVRQMGWVALWQGSSEARQLSRWLGATLLVAVLVFAAAVRLPMLADIPGGINADEGDRAASAFDVLSGQGPASWFDSGWYYINMVYFRLLALSMAAFGADIGGGRMLSALCGVAFVAVVAWVGVRNFGWRTGLLAAALAASMQITIQHSRFLSEAAPTALLWAISIGAFLEGTRTGRLWAWALAGISGGLGLYFYPSARLWAVGAALTVIVLTVQLRHRQLLLGAGVATVAALVASAPFLVHLSENKDETVSRYQQTAVLDPINQQRLEYLNPPEPLPELIALQVERTLGMFDRYPDGGGLLPRPTPAPLFGQPLAALSLIGAVYALVRSRRDPRMAVISIWFWLGLSGVALTVETPDYLRAVGMLPSLCLIVAVLLIDLVDRLVAEAFAPERRALAAGVVPALLAVGLMAQEATGYFATYRTMPSGWGPATREGQAVATLGTVGPVYSLEINEHMVNSGWVKLLAPRAQRGRLPNPGRELPALATIAPATPRLDLKPEVLPGDGQGLSFLLSPDPNQTAYLDLLLELYPGGTIGDAGDGRRFYQLSPEALAATRGVTLIAADGSTRAVRQFGEMPPDTALPAAVLWRAGVLFPHGGLYRFGLSAPGRANLRLDGVALGDGSRGLTMSVNAASGLHFVELGAEVSAAGQPIHLSLETPDGPRQLAPDETYRLMDAPWGLLARKSANLTPTQNGPADALLDSTVAMAFFGPELGFVPSPSTITWSGTIIAPRAGIYRMAFAAEDEMHLQLDGQPVEVQTVRPEQWARVGLGWPVRLSEGPHAVKITLDVTHGGRELARWNWVPPMSNGAVDANGEWGVVPPRVLRPDPPVAVILP